MKDYMLDIEEFCDNYFFGGDSKYEIEEVAAAAKRFFGSSMARAHAIVYLTKTIGKI